MYPVQKGRFTVLSSQRLPLFQNTVRRLNDALSFHVAPFPTGLERVPVAFTQVVVPTTTGFGPIETAMIRSRSRNDT